MHLVYLQQFFHNQFVFDFSWGESNTRCTQARELDDPAPGEMEISGYGKKNFFKLLERGLYLAENWRTLNIVHACLKKLEC